MLKKQTKRLIIFLAIIGLVFNVSSTVLAQHNPHWGNHQPPGGTGNTLPPSPNGVEFIRQDPTPENLQDITIFSSTYKNISLHLEFPDTFDYEIDFGPDGTEYRRYKADSRYQVLSEPGQPEILSRLIWLQVPYDANNIHIMNTKASVKEDTKETVDLYPRPYAVFEDDKERGIPVEREQFYKDSEVYQKDAWDLESDAKIVQEGYKHGMHQIQVAIPVMRYNPKQKSLQEIKALSCTVSYTSTLKKNRIKTYTQDNPFHKIFIDTVANYSYEKIETNLLNANIIEIPLEELDNSSWAAETGFYPDYLVIAAETFHSSEALMKWAVHRAGFGPTHRIAIAYTDEIYQKYTEQDQEEENIQDFISMVYDSWRVHPEAPSLNYLLLVGDADYSHDAASWFLPIWRTEDPLALSGTAGDNDYAWLENGKEEDYLNDVLIGRLPAQTEGQLTIMTDKIINFENNPPQTENHYGTRSLWMSGDISIDVENLSRDLIVNTPEQYQGPYELEEYSYNYEGGISEFQYDSDKIKKFLNKDGALFVSYQGHGYPSLAYENWTGWEPGVTVEHLTNAENMPLLVMSYACSTARFDYAHPEYENMTFPSYGENWIKKEGGGSVCFWGATRLAYSSALELHEEFYQSIIQEGNRNVGVILNELRTHFATEHENLHHKIFNFLGDPAINFSKHFQPSTKPDLTFRGSAIIQGAPTKIGQTIPITASIRNKSQESMLVPYKLFSVKEGNLLPLSGIETIAIEPGDLEPVVTEWTYNAESSMNFMYWIDPTNIIEERSEFNNHLGSARGYFPVHIDKQYVGEEHGTLLSPYRELSSALESLEESDNIGEDYHKKNVTLRLYLHAGVYGQGDELASNKSVLLKGIDGADQTIIYDSLTLNGRYFAIQDVTFNGKKLSGPSLIGVDGNTSLAEILRCVFKKSNDYAIYSDRAIILRNCLIFDNYGVLSDFENSECDKVWIYFRNNTVSKNENNLRISSSHENNGMFELHSFSNIFWENGPSTLPEEFSPDNTPIKIDYSDVDDYVLLNNVYPNIPPNYYEPEGNIFASPMFFDHSNFDFHLKANSPCIDAGEFNNNLDPDGTRNDMGAYGGNQAIMRHLRIDYPINDKTILINPETIEEVPIDIAWTTPYLEQPGNQITKISLYHYEYIQHVPDKGGEISYMSEKVIDLEDETTNTGLYPFILSAPDGGMKYYLDIEMVGDTDAQESIHFKIMNRNSSIKSNR